MPQSGCSCDRVFDTGIQTDTPPECLGGLNDSTSDHFDNEYDEDLDISHSENKTCLNCGGTNKQKPLFTCSKCPGLRLCLDCLYRGLHGEHNSLMFTDIG